MVIALACTRPCDLAFTFGTTFANIPGKTSTRLVQVLVFFRNSKCCAPI